VDRGVGSFGETADAANEIIHLNIGFVRGNLSLARIRFVRGRVDAGPLLPASPSLGLFGESRYPEPGPVVSPRFETGK
jgi:hypothetical protein